MALRFPNGMDECVYFTRRNSDNGKAIAWAFREKCRKCKKSLMGKPKDEKTGSIKIRSPEYTCPSCKFAVPKNEYEDSLTLNIQYTCSCGNSSETAMPFRRKTFQGVKAFVFECGKCKKQIPITKKMSSPKQKKGVVADKEDAEGIDDSA